MPAPRNAGLSCQINTVVANFFYLNQQAKKHKTSAPFALSAVNKTSIEGVFGIRYWVLVLMKIRKKEKTSAIFAYSAVNTN